MLTDDTAKPKTAGADDTKTKSAGADDTTPKTAGTDDTTPKQVSTLNIKFNTKGYTFLVVCIFLG